MPTSADGANLYSRNLRYLGSKLNLRLSGVDYHQQSPVDHCGSSAIILVLEMMALYRYLDGIAPMTLYANSDIKKALEKRLHKEDADPVKKQKLDHE